MAYVNVAEWKTEQVCEWLKGLENSVLPYVHSFTNHGVNGQQLLNLRPEDLEHLGVLKLGHQEIILEAVEYLRNFHYELDRENLQLLALRLSCQAHSLHNELSRQTDSKPVTTQTLSDVASVMMAVKPLVRWLDRPPFSGQLEYNDKKAELMKLALEMATCAQRDRFAEKPIEEIRTTCGQLAKLADYIIQEIADPMILQPASLDLATLKKKPGDDLGFYILPSFHGAHQIAEIKFGSAAHQCGKMEEGDEIVQVNYQTVVGWERKNLLELFRESPAEILLTLKRRPRHTKVYGQIYIKPYRLPSNKKTSYTTRWQHNLPSPRPELLTIPDFTMPLPRHMPKNPSPEPASILDTVNILDTMIIDSSDSDSEAEPPMSIRLYSAKPRNLVQRRATITGASPTTKHGIDIEQFWKELKQEHSTSFQLRDKAASCAHGLDNVPSSNLRPQTCLGIEQTKRRRRDEERKVQFQERPAESEVSLTDGQVAKEEEGRTVGQTCDQNSGQVSHSANVTSSNNASDTSVPLDECSSSSVSGKGSSGKGAAGKDARAQKERGKLDKSYSTPAYDLTDSDDAEDRRQMFLGHNADPTGQNGVQRSVADSQQQAIETREVVDEIGTCCNGNVARRISNIERQIIRQSDNEEQEQQRLAQTEPSYGSSVHDKAVEANRNGTENSQSNNESIIPRVRSKCETKPTVEIRDPVNGAQARPVADNHPEGTNGIVGVGVQSNDKHDRGHQPVERTEKESCAVEKRTVTCPSPVGADPKPVQNIPHIRVTGNTETSDQANDTVVQTPAEQQTPRTTELTRVESSRRPETKAHLTPPEPPPRKYFSKPAGPSTVETLKSQDGERLAVPERPSVRRDLKRSEFLADGQQRADNHQDLPEIYSNYGEKPIEYIDEPVAGNELCLEYGRQGREERPGCDRYETFLEKFAGCPGQSQIDCQRCEPARNVDSPDGSSYGKQSDPNRSRTSEKDKSFERGVVNKAMMVARSIGLHGSLNKSSSSSPRSSRKRSILFARKRNVSVKDIGAGDLEGWLTYRSRGAGGAWAKAWFVLKCSSLYRFKSQSSTRADCLIALTGFTVSQAAEVKSRKYAFKVYHTGTVFYFAADTEDTLALWLEAISRATLGADSHGRNSALFSETDESDSEQQQQQQQHRTREKSVTPTHMDSGTREKSFGSLKKVVRKDSGCGKDHEMAGASLDRKYLRFLGTRNQNVPVPTAQFRSYRRVLPTSSTSTKKQDSTPNSPDLQMTIAGSTFYGLCASQSATDMSSSTQDMGDYRRTTDSSRCRRPDDLQGFITLEEFMLSQQDEERRQVTRHRSVSPRVTPLTSDHVHVQHRNLHDCGPVNDQVRHVNDVAPFGEPPPRSRATNDNEIVVDNGPSYGSYASRNATDNPRAQSKHLTGEFERAESSRPGQSQKKFSDPGHHGHRKRDSVGPAQGTAATRSSEPGPWRSERKQEGLSARGKSSCLVQQSNRATIGSENPHPGYATHAESDSNSQSGYKHEYFSLRHVGNLIEDVRSASRRLARNDGYSGSSSDLTSSHASYETLQRAKKEASVSRKGSFNLSSRREHVATADRHWLDSLRRTDKRCLAGEKSRLKNVAQYQPPPMPSAPFEQEGMRAAFEMHLDKAEHQVQKANRLKSLFGSKYQQKPCTLDLPKDTQKTLLGSPRLHRAIFRDKSTNQPQQRYASRSSSQSPGDSGISQSLSSFSGHSPSQTLSQSFSSVSSASDWSPDTPSSCGLTVSKPCPKGRNSATPPTLPYIPPPTSPPPDYPGLEYPPVFEPGTYSLSDASLLRSRNRANQSANQ